MSDLLRRSFVSVGLFGLAVPGLIAVGANTWQLIGTGCLAGLLSAAVRSK